MIGCVGSAHTPIAAGTAHVGGDSWRQLQWRHDRLVAAARNFPDLAANDSAASLFQEEPLSEAERHELEALRRRVQSLEGCAPIFNDMLMCVR